MSRYLVVANQTVTNPHLVHELRAVTREDPEAQFVLLVPATPVRHLLFRRESDKHAANVARRNAEEARSLLGSAGLPLVDAHVGDGDPLEAIRDELGGEAEYAGIVVSTLQGDDSRWLKAGLPQKAAAETGLPVRHVEAQPTWTAGY